MQKLLACTPMLDLNAPEIQALITRREWRELDAYHRIEGIYNFVRDEILFGYNTDDGIPASHVLADGYGQCNTKGTLFMALLRACEIPCRIHGFTIDKKLQKGAMTGLVYALAPRDVFHSWVEVLYDGRWYALEGLILDRAYLRGLQGRFPNCRGSFCGYGVAAESLQAPAIEWKGCDTYIQSLGIRQDFGLYDSPDDMLRAHRQALSPVKGFVYRHMGRHLMNANVQQIRKNASIPHKAQ